MSNINLSDVKKITIEIGKDMDGRHVVVRGDGLVYDISKTIENKETARQVINFRGEVVYTIMIEYKE